MKKVAIVTGASKGIGAATAVKLSESGFHVIAVSRNKDLLNIIKSDNIEPYVMDVTDTEAINSFQEYIKDKQVQLLVNNAGGGSEFKNVDDSTRDEWRYCYEVNVISPMHLSQIVIPIMQRIGGGHIIMISSIAAYKPYPTSSNYSAAKMAQSVLSNTMRQELVNKNIKVTEIIPGNVATSGPQYGSISSEDMAGAIAWCANLPDYVSVNSLSMSHIKNI